MRRKEYSRKSLVRSHITKDILLKLLKTGVVLTVALTAPNALRVLKSYMKEKDPWKEYYPSSIRRCTVRLWRKGFVEVKESKNGYQVCLTHKGVSQVLEYDLNAMGIPEQNPWDKKWRMVFFDIPAGEKVRHVFRRQLQELGFFPMQESVYVYPYPCTKEIQFLREVYGIPHEVKLAVVERLENDQDLRRYFSL